MGYYIMPRYETEFGDYIKTLQGVAKIDTILKFVIDLIDILRVIHDAGKVHNDVKPSNIMVHNGKPILIDFEFFTDHTNVKPGEKVSMFHGNFQYGSLNELEFNKTTRKDDMISLFYVLVFSLRDFTIPLNGHINMKFQ